MSATKIIFVTGTDTGVGKTLLTALMLCHLRRAGVRALAMKPFCSGGTADVRLLQSVQPGELSDKEMNPFYFGEPVAPLVAKGGKNVSLRSAVAQIRAVERKCERLLVEGSGGLMVPLGKGYTVGDLIAELGCKVVVAGRNRLGTINHTLLTVNALKGLGIEGRNMVVVLMGVGKPDVSSKTNLMVLRGLLGGIRVFGLPFLGMRAANLGVVKRESWRVGEILKGF